MGKKIKLGDIDPTIFSLNVYGYDENGDEKQLGNFCDKDMGITIEVDIDELSQSIANSKNSSKGNMSATNFLKRMIKTSSDIIDDEIFDMCKVLLDECAKRSSGSAEHLFKASSFMINEMKDW